MLIDEIKEILAAKHLYQPEFNYNDRDITTACGADLMSDVLAFSQEKTLLLTGLVNPQVVRTAEMTDIDLIVFVRGKQPPEETIKLAKEKEIILLKCNYSLFHSCGLLYQQGIKPENIIGTG